VKKRTEQERRLAAALARERTLAELTGALAAELDETLVLQLAVDHAARLLEAPRARVWLVEPDRSLVCAASHDAHGPAGLGRRLPADSVGGLVAHGETLTLDDITAHPAFHNLGPSKPGPLRAYLGTPIRRAGVPLGTIEVLAELGRRFGPDEAGLLRVLADAVAVAVANARSHRAVRAELAERQRAEALERHLAAQRQQLLELSRTLLGTLSLDEVIDRILAGLGQVLAYDMAGI
jgi:GAF domain-containing protein